MSILEKLSEQNREAQRAAECRGRLLSLLRYTASILDGQGVRYDIDIVDGGTRMLIDIDLDPPPAIAPQADALSLPSPQVPPEAGAVAVPEEKPEPEGEVAPADPAPEPAAYKTGDYSPEEMETIRRMIDAGKSNGEVAAVLGRRPQAVGSKLTSIRRDRARRKKAGRKSPPVVTPEAASPAELQVEPAPATAPVDAPMPDPEPAAACAAPEKAAPKVSGGSASVLPGAAPPFNPEIPYAEQMIERHLDGLGNLTAFSPADDLQLVSELATGSKAVDVAILLETTPETVKVRWGKLNQRPGDLDHQQLLIKVLRRRAEAGV